MNIAQMIRNTLVIDILSTVFLKSVANTLNVKKHFNDAFKISLISGRNSQRY